MAEVRNITELFTHTYARLAEEEKSPEAIQDNWFSPESLQQLSDKLRTFGTAQISPEDADWLNTPEVSGLIELEIHPARESFIYKLQARGVHPAYIGELNYVTPSESVQYHDNLNTAAENGSAGFRQDGNRVSFTTDYDPTKKKISLPKGVIYSTAKKLQGLEIFSKCSKEQLLKLSTRILTYHELAHSLQQAYANCNGVYREGFGIGRVKGERLEAQGSHMFAEKNSNLAALDETLTAEKQAEGLANDFLAEDLLSDLSWSGVNVDRRTVDYWLRRKSFTTNNIRDDRALQNIHSLTKIVLLHAQDIDFRLVRNKLQQVLRDYPALRRQVEQFDIAYTRGLLMPYSPKAMHRVYTILSQAPSKEQPARKPDTSP